MAGSAYAPGDVNLDGAVTAPDLVLLAAFLAGNNDLAAAAAADLNGDAGVNGVDLDCLLQSLAGNFKRALPEEEE